MKMRKILAILTVAVLFMNTFATVGTAFAGAGKLQEDMTELFSRTITTIYSQKDYWDPMLYWMPASDAEDPMKRGGDFTRTLASYGCGVFTIAHAVQWLTGNDPTITTVRDNCGNTSDYNGGMRNHAMNYLKDTYNISSEEQGSEVSDIEETFDNGGVIIAVTADCTHYFLGVEYIVYNGETYVHVIDSSADYTLSKGYTGYWIDSMEPISDPQSLRTSEFGGEGLEFWIPMEQFQQKVLLSLTA